MRPVRLSEAAVDDITTQVPDDRLEGFRAHDLAPALHFMSTTSALGDYDIERWDPGRPIGG